uniref:Uncharacterized protein n=1 Tax=Arundo donax TaxID=35708 RepID=A0A0A9GHK8_ARUDO
MYHSISHTSWKDRTLRAGNRYGKVSYYRKTKYSYSQAENNID